MLILVAVTISMAINGGLFDYARKATGETQNAIDKEQELANLEANLTVDELIDKYTGEEKEYIGTDKSYVGYYADIDSNGTVDGIIYADLAVGNTGDGQWTNSNGNYDIPTETGLKEYYVSQTDYVGTFGTDPRDVITATGGEGNDRFYVMALSDVTTEDYTTFYWYYNASAGMSDYETATSGDFGTGKANTEKIKGYWDKDEESPYGAQSSGDLWALIDSDCNRTWFVPSRGEWAAFAEELGITDSNYSSYDLSGYYWPSSHRNSLSIRCAAVCSGCISSYSVIDCASLRLSATF